MDMTLSSAHTLERRRTFRSWALLPALMLLAAILALPATASAAAPQIMWNPTQKLFNGSGFTPGGNVELQQYDVSKQRLLTDSTILASSVLYAPVRCQSSQFGCPT